MSSDLLLKLVGGLVFLILIFYIFKASKRQQENQLELTKLINKMRLDNADINSTKPTMEVISVEPIPNEETPPTRSTPALVEPIPNEETPPALVEPRVVNNKTVSTNGRCGPKFENTRCTGKTCCSLSGWCAGTQGTYSAWCYKNGKGRLNGVYDGRD